MRGDARARDDEIGPQAVDIGGAQCHTRAECDELAGDLARPLVVVLREHGDLGTFTAGRQAERPSRDRVAGAACPKHCDARRRIPHG